MNKFNLTFNGEILAGHDADLVKLRFAEMFDIDDPARLETFFSGKTHILRRNLERKDAAQHYHELQLLGAGAVLVKVTARDMADGIVNEAHAQKPTQDAVKTLERTASKKATAQTRAAATAPVKNNSANLPRNARDAAADIKARKLAAQRLAAEKKALEQAVLEEKHRQIAAEAAREKALADERHRLSEEVRIQKEAELARLAAEQAAQKAAEKAEAQRLEAEEIARKKAQKDTARRKSAEETAKRKAVRKQQKAEKARRKAEEAAQRKAELEQKQRLAAEEESRRTAEIQEKQRLAEVEAARLKAQREEKQRLAAEKEAIRNAAIEKQRRIAAATAEAESRRLAALGAIKQREAEAAEQLQAQLEDKARKAAASAAKIKAEADRLLVQAQRKALEQPRNSDAKPAKNRVRSKLELKLKEQAQVEETGVSAQRKLLSGEPNLYSLKPFRNSEEVRARSALSHVRMRQGYTITALALAALLIAGGMFLQQGEHPVVRGANAIAINSNLEPLLLAGESILLHDRAGVSKTVMKLSEMGLRKLEPPMEFDGTGGLLARGQLLDDIAADSQYISLELLRCNLDMPSCQPLSTQLADHNIAFFAVNPLDGSLLLADSIAGELLKLDSSGAIVASSAVGLPRQPILRIHDGLLLVNSAEGPAISVFRYDDNAFGTQLDEILLMPKTSQPLEHYRVSDFVWSGDAWWVNLRHPESNSNELHRFDKDWSYLDTIKYPASSGPLQLVPWGQKTLANDPGVPAIQRYNADGVAEAPFVSTQLQEIITAQQGGARFAALAWHTVLLVCALTTAAGLCFSYLQASRALVYNARREQGAEPLDAYSAQLRWVDPIENRQVQLKKMGIYYSIAVLGAVLLATALSVNVWQLAALLLALSGPAIALLLLSRQPVGHIGTLDDKLLLVDHTGMYHIARGSRLQYRGPFLAIDDVVVFAGTPSLPAFNAAQIKQQVSPLALGGIKVDQKILLVKLLQCHHPLALGASAILVTLVGAALLLSLTGIY